MDAFFHGQRARLLQFTQPLRQRFPCGCKFSNLHFPDKMKSCRHKRRGVRVFNLWVRVFNLHFPDTMKSCHHTTYYGEHPRVDTCPSRAGRGSGLTGPHRRTFAPAIQASAHSMLTGAPASCLRRPIRLRRIGARATPALGARPAPHGFCIRNGQLQRARGWSFALPLNPSTTSDEITASSSEPVEDQIPVSLVATRFPSCRRHVQVGKLAPTWENCSTFERWRPADTVPES